MGSNAEKKNQRAVNLDGEDLISGLSESILSHILNFLPTKDAVRTSVLAQSWKNKWRLITSIDLHDFLTDLDREEDVKERAHSFLMFVNRVLRQISSPTICRFRLHLSERLYDPHDLTVLFSDVLRRGVQELDINYVYDIPFFPTSVFNCRSLIKLVLDMDYCTIRVPSSIGLPNLQALVLAGIQFLVVDDLFPHSKDLVLSFPVLKSFESYRCDWSNVKDISINVPILETFTMDYPHFDFEHFDDEFDDDFDDETKSYAFKILAPNLRAFSYQFSSTEDIIFSYASSIQEAYIGVSVESDLEEESEIGVKMGMLLKVLNRVERLKLQFDQFQIRWFLGLLDHVNDNLATLPAFGRLLQLELALPRCLASQKILLNLIHRSPILRTLLLNYALTEFDNHLLLVKEVPHCFLYSLEAVEFIVPKANAVIISQAKYVLEHSRVLKLMTVRLSLEKPDVIEQVNQVLLSSPRASSIVTIKVE